MDQNQSQTNPNGSAVTAGTSPTNGHDAPPAEEGQLVPVAGEDEEAGLLARWEKGAVIFCTTLDVETDYGRAMMSVAMETADMKTRNAVGNDQAVVDVVAHAVTITNPETGEITPTIRAVLILDNGKTLSTTSGPCIKSLAFLLKKWGKGPFIPPKIVRFREHAMGDGRSYCTLAEVVTAKMREDYMKAAAKAVRGK